MIVEKKIVFFILLAFILLFFTNCAPKDEAPKCGEPNQYQCVNTCDGLYVRREFNWQRFYKNELDCNVERNMIYEVYDNEIH
jgi:hypothetical protein